jgi:hypothetical protein
MNNIFTCKSDGSTENSFMIEDASLGPVLNLTA